MTIPDIFTQVHKGIRRALFSTCTALGRASDEDESGPAARSALRETLHFVAHHGENEDVLLLPLLKTTSPEIAAHMQGAHETITKTLEALTQSIEAAPLSRLYADMTQFVELYLGHMRDEEEALEPRIRAAVAPEAIADMGRQAIARTAPADQRMMLGWMVPAMVRSDADALLGKLPEGLANELRALAGL